MFSAISDFISTLVKWIKQVFAWIVAIPSFIVGLIESLFVTVALIYSNISDLCSYVSSACDRAQPLADGVASSVESNPIAMWIWQSLNLGTAIECIFVLFNCTIVITVLVFILMIFNIPMIYINVLLFRFTLKLSSIITGGFVKP